MANRLMFQIGTLLVVRESGEGAWHGGRPKHSVAQPQLTFRAKREGPKL